jgi:hypothetical protein
MRTPGASASAARVRSRARPRCLFAATQRKRSSVARATARNHQRASALFKSSRATPQKPPRPKQPSPRALPPSFQPNQPNLRATTEPPRNNRTSAQQPNLRATTEPPRNQPNLRATTEPPRNQPNQRARRKVRRAHLPVSSSRRQRGERGPSAEPSSKINPDSQHALPRDTPLRTSV